MTRLRRVPVASPARLARDACAAARYSTQERSRIVAVCDEGGCKWARFFDNLYLVLVGLALGGAHRAASRLGLPADRPATCSNGVPAVAARVLRDHLDRPALLFQLRADPDDADIPAELKPGVSKYIAPSALFYFRWGAAFTVLTGLCWRGPMASSSKR